MGQAYYELEKQDEASDLQNLVAFVKRNKDHIKLLMNSRANIINTAMKLRIGESILADMKATKRFIKAGELTRMERLGYCYDMSFVDLTLSIMMI